MPPVAKPLRRERAARLRDAGQSATRRFCAAQIGRTMSVLAESEDAGHSEHFAPVQLARAVEPGQVVAARAVAATAGKILAEPV
jgi:threonylcarbamoyladenosine tRNA methylthiotransferase MtaB